MKNSRSNSVCATEIGATHGPLGDYPEKFLSYLTNEHYSRKSIHDYIKRLNVLNRQMTKHGVDPMDLDEDRAYDLVTGGNRTSSRRKDILFSVRHFMRFLNASGAGKPGPHVEIETLPWDASGETTKDICAKSGDLARGRSNIAGGLPSAS